MFYDVHAFALSVLPFIFFELSTMMLLDSLFLNMQLKIQSGQNPQKDSKLDVLGCTLQLYAPHKPTGRLLM